MLCQNCQKRPASIHLFAKVNGQSREINLCGQCYQQLKQQGNINMNNDNNGFFGDLSDFFNYNGNAGNPGDPRMSTGGPGNANGDRKSVVEGKSVGLGGRRNSKKKTE